MTVERIVMFALFTVSMTMLEKKMGGNIYLGALIGMLWGILIDIF